MEINRISLVYIFTHLGRRLLDFLRHWYSDGFYRASHWALGFLERLDKYFALRITAKNWFQPLYQDYSFIGYMWGFVFRTIRIFTALMIYVAFLVIFGILFAAWLLIPPYIAYQIISNIQ